MSDLIDTTEMYLRTILELEEEGHVPMRARISERLDQSGPTVSETVARMEKNGLVVVSGDRHLELTEVGRKLAIEVMRKHRLAELLLAKVIGLEWHLVHEEACRWEHVMSEQVERRILELVPESEISPFGNPVPGLELLGRKPSRAISETVTPLIEHLDELVTIKRIAEPLQLYPDALAHLAAAGILPGVKVEARQAADRIEVRAEGSEQSINLTAFDAAHIFVSQA
ncbi:MAG: metal-dependent transcriptional regulator [Microbacteriaceae bacterium]|nr:metal-dependent transcriptional regulator [Microbacteriaceae bacterium]